MGDVMALMMQDVMALMMEMRMTKMLAESKEALEEYLRKLTSEGFEKAFEVWEDVSNADKRFCRGVQMEDGYFTASLEHMERMKLVINRGRDPYNSNDLWLSAPDEKQQLRIFSRFIWAELFNATNTKMFLHPNELFKEQVVVQYMKERSLWSSSKNREELITALKGCGKRLGWQSSTFEAKAYLAMKNGKVVEKKAKRQYDMDLGIAKETWKFQLPDPDELKNKMPTDEVITEPFEYALEHGWVQFCNQYGRWYCVNSKKPLPPVVEVTVFFLDEQGVALLGFRFGKPFLCTPNPGKNGNPQRWIGADLNIKDQIGKLEEEYKAGKDLKSYIKAVISGGVLPKNCSEAFYFLGREGVDQQEMPFQTGTNIDEINHSIRRSSITSSMDTFSHPSFVNIDDYRSSMMDTKSSGENVATGETAPVYPKTSVGVLNDNAHRDNFELPKYTFDVNDLGEGPVRCKVSYYEDEFIGAGKTLKEAKHDAARNALAATDSI